MFEFQFNFPTSYPSDAPKVIAVTTNFGRTRFNPNIYADGKVCLSILGTWHGQPGEQWSSAHGVLSVLISIQSLMSDKPYHNEPGFEKAKSANAEKEVDKYNRKIMHETIRISICNRLEKILKNVVVDSDVSSTSDSASSSPAHAAPCTNKTTTQQVLESSSVHAASSSSTSIYGPSPFDDTCKMLFLAYYFNYLDIVERETKLIEHGEQFARMPFESTSNSMSGAFDYPDLESRLKQIYQKLMAETQQWIRDSNSDDIEEISTTNNLRIQFHQLKNEKEFENQMDFELDDDNPYVWQFTVFGTPMTQYEGGIFRGQIVFHKSFPAFRPRIRFLTPVYHPNITSDGVPYMRIVKAEDIKAHLLALLALFTDDPIPHPSTHLNLEAARLYFGNKDERKEFNRNARRCASRSIEY
ncbi:ubiquitin-conjugating enzyme/RWD-like protein [Paraphysoderma sedebokerense]|nr:ubiquitin-conjugating enzyme/RWD-like protein [Paraphysoderma sedebokerense]